MAASSSQPAADPDRQHSRNSTSSASSFFAFPITHTVSGLLRRISTDPVAPTQTSLSAQNSAQMSGLEGVYTPPRRHASPFQPPPLTPLTLQGYREETADKSKLLTRALAEEIRLLVPPRLQLVEDWTLAYSLEQNGVSLATLYEKCEAYRGKRGGYVLVVRDGGGGVSTPNTTQTTYSSRSPTDASLPCTDIRRISE